MENGKWKKGRWKMGRQVGKWDGSLFHKKNKIHNSKHNS